ncbi:MULTISPECIES: hypothetical protein [unclassified Mesorhizobium]|uniref:hypothetical protein n=1 Tax=unclassified Mesorhizobium TaxID=325217 RepID=UPI00333B946D
MARGALLKEHERKTLLDIPIDEDSLIRHYSLAPADLPEIRKRYFPRTLTPALSTDGLRIGNGIWSDQAAVALAKLKGSRS